MRLVGGAEARGYATLRAPYLQSFQTHRRPTRDARPSTGPARHGAGGSFDACRYHCVMMSRGGGERGRVGGKIKGKEGGKKKRRRGYPRQQRDKDGDRLCGGTSTGVRTAGPRLATRLQRPSFREDGHRRGDTPEPPSRAQPPPPLA